MIDASLFCVSGLRLRPEFLLDLIIHMKLRLLRQQSQTGVVGHWNVSRFIQPEVMARVASRCEGCEAREGREAAIA